MNTAQTQFDDTYTGVRYRYGSDIHAFATLFWRWIVNSDRSNYQYEWGTLDSWQQIPARMVKAWELELVAVLPAKDDDESMQLYRLRLMRGG